MSRDQFKRLKELETKNTRLGRAVSDLTLDSFAQIPLGIHLGPDIRGALSGCSARHRRSAAAVRVGCAGLPPVSG